MNALHDRLMDIGYKMLEHTGTPETDQDHKIAGDFALGVLDNIKSFVATGRWSWDDPAYRGWEDGDDEYTVAYKSSMYLTDMQAVISELYRMANNDKDEALRLIADLRASAGANNPS